MLQRIFLSRKTRKISRFPFHLFGGDKRVPGPSIVIGERGYDVFLVGGACLGEGGGRRWWAKKYFFGWRPKTTSIPCCHDFWCMGVHHGSQGEIMGHELGQEVLNSNYG